VAWLLWIIGFLTFDFRSYGTPITLSTTTDNILLLFVVDRVMVLLSMICTQLTGLGIIVPCHDSNFMPLISFAVVNTTEFHAPFSSLSPHKTAFDRVLTRTKSMPSQRLESFYKNLCGLDARPEPPTAASPPKEKGALAGLPPKVPKKDDGEPVSLSGDEAKPEYPQIRVSAAATPDTGHDGKESYPLIIAAPTDIQEELTLESLGKMSDLVR
jgi:hypothetical protein